MWGPVHPHRWEILIPIIFYQKRWPTSLGWIVTTTNWNTIVQHGWGNWAAVTVQVCWQHPFHCKNRITHYGWWNQAFLSTGLKRIQLLYGQLYSISLVHLRTIKVVLEPSGSPTGPMLSCKKRWAELPLVCAFGECMNSQCSSHT